MPVPSLEPFSLALAFAAGGGCGALIWSLLCQRRLSGAPSGAEEGELAPSPEEAPSADVALQNREELLLEESQLHIVESEQRMAEVLRSMSEGMVVVDAALCLSGIYSAAAERLLEVDKLEGRPFGDVFFPEPDDVEQEVEKQRVLGFLATAFELLVPEQFDDLGAEAPSSFRFRLSNGVIRKYSIRYHPMIRDDLIVAVTVLFTDVTHTEGTESTHFAESSSVQQAFEFLSIQLSHQGKRASFEGFVSEMLPLATGACASLSEIETLDADSPRASELIAEAFRQVHTIKGASRMFGLSHIHEFSHAAEMILSEARNGRVFPDELSYTELPARMENLVGSLRSLETIVAQLGEIEADRALVWQEFTSQVQSAVVSHAESVGKAVQVEFCGTAPETREELRVLRMVLPHMLHNAVDHGIEPPEERLRANKPRVGTLQVELDYGSAGCFLQIGDDGAGIERRQLAEKALEKGVLSTIPDDPLDIDLVTILCCPGFSSAQAVTHTSGRGVGMDVVREEVERMGGALSLESVPGVGTHVILSWDRQQPSTRSRRLPKGAVAA